MTTTPAPLAPELARAGLQGLDLVRNGARALRHPSQLTWYCTLVATAWAVGIAGDAYTTLAMMGTGLFEEANGIAAVGMHVLSPVGYVVAASALCALMGTATAARPRGLYAWVMWTLLAVLGAAKVYTAVSNVMVWTS